MIKNIHCIKVDGKELKTEKEFIGYYLKKLGDFKKADKDFIELPFVKNERKWVLEILHDFEPADNDAKVFKINLGRYLASFLNGRSWVAEEEFKNHPNNFEKSVDEEAEKDFSQAVKWFEDQISNVTESELIKKFIEQQIAKTEATSVKWLNEVKDLSTNYRLKGHFKSGQKFLAYLKEQLYELTENRIYFIKNGKQVMSSWDFLTSTGLVKSVKDKHGVTINPTHNFKLLKLVRLQFFENAKQKFIEERTLNH